MTLITLSHASDYTNVANFRLNLKDIGTSIVNTGWVRTPDTGQINWASVALPTVANQVSGYEMFRMADTLQATAPVFMKIEYGLGINGAGYPGLWVTFGSSTNGAGVLAGYKSSRMISGGYGDPTIDLSRFSGDPSRLVFSLWPVIAATMSPFVSVERTHDGDGADTGKGIMIEVAGMSSHLSQYLPMNGDTIVPAGAYNCSCVIPVGGGLSGSDYALFPVRWFTPGESVPSKNFAYFFGTDIASIGVVLNVSNWWGGVTPFYTLAMPGINYGGQSKLAMRND